MSDRVEFLQADWDLRDELEAVARLRIVECSKRIEEAAASRCWSAVEGWRAAASRAQQLLNVANSPNATLRMPGRRPAGEVEGG